MLAYTNLPTTSQDPRDYSVAITRATLPSRGGAIVDAPRLSMFTGSSRTGECARTAPVVSIRMILSTAIEPFAGSGAPLFCLADGGDA